MGIKGLYGYCLKNIPECSKKVNIIEEIEKYKNENGENSKILVDLYTLTYHYQVKKMDLICGYQLNKIKYDAEKFFQKMIDAGAELIFTFKKNERMDFDNPEFLERRLEDYKSGLEIIQKIQKVQDFDELMKKCSFRKLPFNILITACLVQSAHKFGKVYGYYHNNSPYAIVSSQLAIENGCNCILGLSTSRFMSTGNYKIWSDERLDMNRMEVLEIDKDVIMRHFQIDHNQGILFNLLSGSMKTEKNIMNKISNYFGTQSRFKSIPKFIREIEFPLDDEKIKNIAIKIFGENYDPTLFIEDMKKNLDVYLVDSMEKPTYEYDDDIIQLIKNDFLSYAEQILLNEMPILTSPVFLDLSSPDMENFNSLVLPWIQKTAGILLKNSPDHGARDIFILENPKEGFKKIPLKIIYPKFEVPSIKTLLTGELSTYQKMEILFWLMDFELDSMEIPYMEEEYTVDCMILMYLVKKNSLTVLDARCILKTLVDARSKVIPLEYSTEYPKKINSRALRCTHLYCKMYFILHSCLACFGMKNFCPEMKFDGVYFQKMYSLNVLEEPEDDDEEFTLQSMANIVNTRESEKLKKEDKHEVLIIPNEKDVDQTELVEMFSKIVRGMNA